MYYLVPDSPLKRRPSKDSIQSTTSNATSAALLDAAISSTDGVEELMRKENTPAVISAIPAHMRHDSPGLIRRNPSFTSSAGESRLGRIQLTLRYSVARQKLIIVVHKIA